MAKLMQQTEGEARLPETTKDLPNSKEFPPSNWKAWLLTFVTRLVVSEIRHGRLDGDKAKVGAKAFLRHYDQYRLLSLSDIDAMSEDLGIDFPWFTPVLGRARDMMEQGLRVSAFDRTGANLVIALREAIESGDTAKQREAIAAIPLKSGNAPTGLAASSLKEPSSPEVAAAVASIRAGDDRDAVARLHVALDAFVAAAREWVAARSPRVVERVQDSSNDPDDYPMDEDFDA